VAARATDALGAQAFTVGQDVTSPPARSHRTPAGKKLLVYELTHAVQELRGAAGAGGDGLRVSQPGEPLEREAE
jgi:hypothetical protein